MEKLDTSILEIKMPFPVLFGFKVNRKVGFKFGTLAYDMMCHLFVPKIDFDQIDEVSKSKPDVILQKLICGGAHSYAWEFHKKNRVTEKLIKYWLEKLPAKKRDAFISSIQIAILNGKIVGKSMTEIIQKKK